MAIQENQRERQPIAYMGQLDHAYAWLDYHAKEGAGFAELPEHREIISRFGYAMPKLTIIERPTDAIAQLPPDVADSLQVRVHAYFTSALRLLAVTGNVYDGVSELFMLFTSPREDPQTIMIPGEIFGNMLGIPNAPPGLFYRHGSSRRIIRFVQQTETYRISHRFHKYPQPVEFAGVGESSVWIGTEHHYQVERR
jgi:hypothetical protein